MKSLRMLVVGLVAGALLATAGTSLAAPAISKVTAMLRPDYNVKVDGKKVTMKNAPLTYNGSTYVPLREAGEILGYSVGFNAGTITLDSKKGTTATDTGSKLDAKALVELLARKYPDQIRTISLSEEGKLTIGDKSYNLQKDQSGLYDTVPLIESGVLSESDFQ